MDSLNRYGTTEFISVYVIFVSYRIVIFSLSCPIPRHEVSAEILLAC